MKPSLVVVLPFCAKDFELAKNLLRWIYDLDNGENKHHSMILVCEEQCPLDKRLEIKELAQKSFGFVGVLPVKITAVFQPNQMFVAAAKQIGDTVKLPWFWMEPDCTPLKRDWLDTLAEAYEKSPMKFMGPLVKAVNQPEMPAVHLTGTAIYSQDAWQIYHNVPALMQQIVAWDVHMHKEAVPRTANTDLIHHVWGEKDFPPVFVEKKLNDSPKNAVTLDFVSPKAVLFHRVKDGSLIALLRKKYDLPLKIAPAAAAVNKAKEQVPVLT